jgi:hypothetical protein
MVRTSAAQVRDDKSESEVVPQAPSQAVEYLQQREQLDFRQNNLAHPCPPCRHRYNPIPTFRRKPGQLIHDVNIKAAETAAV